MNTLEFEGLVMSKAGIWVDVVRKTFKTAEVPSKNKILRFLGWKEWDNVYDGYQLWFGNGGQKWQIISESEQELTDKRSILIKMLKEDK